MTTVDVPLGELIAARAALVAEIVGRMPEAHRQFRVGFKQGAPDWALLGRGIRMRNNSKMLALIAACEDAGKLRQWIANGRKEKQIDIEEAAFRRLIAILPKEEPGTVEHDFWRTVHAFEHVLSEERGKTTRLARTRQKVARVGEIATLKDWALSTKSTDGFDMLIERGMPELAGEAIVLRHSERFDAAVVAAARERLEGAGIDPDKLPTGYQES